MKTALFSLGLILIFFAACAQKRVVKYESLLNPMVGVSKKISVNKKLGQPVYCKAQEDGEICEYRTPKSHNENIPAIYQPAHGFPDLSPYDYFDVLHLSYNSFGILKDWEPIVLAP